MKLHLFPLALILVSSPVLKGQVSYSAPLGLTTYSFPAGNSTSFISFPLYPAPLFNGYASQNATAQTVTVVGVSAATGTLTSTLSPAFALVTSGNATTGQQGRSMRITANVLTSVGQQPANVLTLDTTDNTPASTSTPLNGPSFSIMEGDKVQVFQGYTLSTLFGNSAATLRFVQGGATSALADTVSIFNIRTRKFDQYFFNTTANAWNLVGGGTANAGNVIVYPESAPQITRKTTAQASVAGLTGSVPIVPPSVKTLGGTITYTSFRMPIQMLLSQLTGALSPQGFTPNTSFLTATGLGVYGLNSGTPGLFYLNGTWFTSSGQPAGTVQIFPSSAQAIVNRNSAGTVAFVKLPKLPYTPQ
jgi:hypothetical protein